METEISIISKFVKESRKKVFLTQEQLAEKLGCTKGNVSAWERGHHQPSYKQLCELSEMSGIPLPHDRASKSQEILKLLNIDPDKLDVDQIDVIKKSMLVKKENLPHLKKIIGTYIDDAEPEDKKSNK